jgi:outer membrane protein assembly factor BamA
MTRLVIALALGMAVFGATSTASAQNAGGDADGFVEKAKEWAERTQIVERLSGEVDGWYPRLGGMTRGSGFAVGPGYRRHVFGDRVLVDLSAGLSTKFYKAIDAKVRWVQAWDERVEFWTNYRYEDFPQEDFFGLGIDSRLDTRTSYDFDSSDVHALGVLKPTTWSRLSARIGYTSPEIGPGTDDEYPSIEQLFTDVEAPGLLAQPNYLHTTLSGEIDYRDQRGNPRNGGYYTVSFGIFDDRNLEQFDFRRLDGTAIQYVPLTPARDHVVSGRVGFSYVNNEPGNRVPFYFLAYVGGTDTIRGYREFRFKDENALWMNLEYKWTPMKYVSLVGFLDAGEVRPDWQDIDLNGLKKGYGFGFRVHTDTQTFARFDFGTGGGEGWQMFMKLGPSF